MYRKRDFENRYWLLIAFIVPLVFFTIAFVVPVFSILISGISKIPEILGDSYYRKVLGFTYYQALLSAFFAVVCSLPAAFFLYRYDFRGSSLLKAFATVPFVVPPIIAVLGFVNFFGNAGYINKFLISLFNLEAPPLRLLYSFKAIIVVHVFYNLPVSMKIILDRLEKTPINLYQTSLTLGANRFKSFFRIIVPFILPSLISAFVIIFLYCFLSFAVIYVLSGGPRFSVIEIEVFNFIKNSMDYSSAAALSLCGMVLCFATAGILLVIRNRLRFKFQESKVIEKKKAGEIFKKPHLLAFFVLYLLFYLFVSVAPILSVIVQSFLDKDGGFTLLWFKQIFASSMFSSLSSSFLVASLVSVITSIISLVYSYYALRNGRLKSWLSLFFMMPLFISPFLVAGGYLLFGSSVDLGNPFFLLILAHCVTAFPISFKFISNGIFSYNKNLTLASYSLGRNSFFTFLRVELPYILPAIFSQMVFAFAVSAGELSAALIFASNSNQTVPVQISRLLSSYRIELACALGSVLIFICFGVFLIIEILNKNGKIAEGS
ncbi:MAG: iron ABC transporter permease [Spirochaetales bacterium]|nr:iron ABC transporter permease [Spirochaetales bacterium]